MSDSDLQTFKTWLMIGLISFGGPAGSIAIMYDEVVEKHKWLTPKKFNFAMNYCMMLPGPAAMQLSIYLGWLMKGVRGGIVSGVAYVLPSLVLMLCFSMAYVQFSKLSWVNAIFEGMKPCVVAIILNAVIKMGKRASMTPFNLIISLLTFVVAIFTSIPIIAVMMATVFAAVMYDYTRKLLKLNHCDSSEILLSASNQYSPSVNQGYRSGNSPLSTLLKTLIVTKVLWILPWLLFVMCSPEFDFWHAMVASYSKAALISFGGAYAVLPYMAEISINKFQWITEAQMIDAIALGESIPGPLVKILTFIGFISAQGYYNGSLAYSALGFFVAAYYTFMPCFAFIFLGAPIIDRFEGNTRLQSILEALTAAVIGLMLQLGVFLGFSVLNSAESNYFTYAANIQVSWLLIMFTLITLKKVSVPIAILLSGAYGFVIFYLLSAHM